MTGRNESGQKVAVSADAPSPTDPYLQDLLTLDIPENWKGAYQDAFRAMRGLEDALTEIKAHNARMRVLTLEPIDRTSIHAKVEFETSDLYPQD